MRFAHLNILELRCIDFYSSLRLQISCVSKSIRPPPQPLLTYPALHCLNYQYLVGWPSSSGTRGIDGDVADCVRDIGDGHDFDDKESYYGFTDRSLI